MDQWVARRAQLGLSVSDVVNDHTWFVQVPAADQKTWHLENIHALHPFEAALVVFEHEDVILGYLWYHEVTEHIDRASLHTDFSGILMYPWEHSTNAEKNNEPITLTLPWHGCQDVRLSDDDDIVDFATRKTMDAMLGVNISAPNDPVLHRVMANATEESVRTWLTTRDYETTQATVEDVRQYMIRRNITLVDGPASVPSVMFVVPYEHTDGSYHVSHGYTARVAWTEMEAILQKRLYLFQCVHVPRSILKGRGTLQLEQLKHMNKKTKKKKEMIPKQKSNMHSDVTRETFDVPDIEDLVNRASPPCLQQLMSAKKWYKDQERVHLARQLQSGGIPVEMADHVFERAMTYNENHKNTWNHAQTWEKKYNGCRCEDFIENAQYNVANTIHCPVFVANGKTSPEDTRRQCAATFAKRYPLRTRTHDVLKRPYQWYLWYYGRTKE